MGYKNRDTCPNGEDCCEVCKADELMPEDEGLCCNHEEGHE